MLLSPGWTLWQNVKQCPWISAPGEDTGNMNSGYLIVHTLLLCDTVKDKKELHKINFL